MDGQNQGPATGKRRWFSGWGRQPAQAERILRGERTDPRAVLATCAAFALVGIVFVVVAYALIGMWMERPWEWLRTHIRELATGLGVSVLAGCVIALGVLWYEAWDPNYPGTRPAIPTSRVVYPWSKETIDRELYYEQDGDTYELPSVKI